MVCPKCGMKIRGKRDRCNHCGAPIPAELGGDRPDPIFDDEYDWLNADKLRESAAESEKKPEYAPKREERKLAEQEKAEKRPANKGLIILLVMASLVLLIMALLLMLYLKWDFSPEIEHTADGTPRPVYDQLDPAGDSADSSFEAAPSAESAFSPLPSPAAEPVAEPPAEPSPSPTPAPTPTPAEADGEEHILPESNSRYLTRGDLAGLSQQECCLARNEIYARHGRIFVNGSISRYFNSKDWYSPTVSGNDFRDSVLNEYELANIKLISDYEQEKWGGSYY